MANTTTNTTTGKLGLTIPVQKLSESQLVKMTPQDIMDWRNHLPMADIGATANQVFHVLNDCNQVDLPSNLRFEILELLRTPVQFICQSIRKHYLNQTENLTATQLTIIQLADTLQSEMALGYKLILEKNVDKSDTRAEGQLHVIIERINHYFKNILLRKYQLYSEAPENLWKEFYIIFKYAESRKFISDPPLLRSFSHTLLMAATSPFKWRQNEQDALFNATELWADTITVQSDKTRLVPGVLAFDLLSDVPPELLNEQTLHTMQEGRFLEVKPLVDHLKQMIAELEPNEIQVRLKHAQELEFTVPLFVLKELVKIWEFHPSRSEPRTAPTVSKKIELVTGLSAAHYFLSGEQPFKSMEQPQETATLQEYALPSLSIQEESKSSPYHKFSCSVINESAHGRNLRWEGAPYPPIQPGELLALWENNENTANTADVANATDATNSAHTANTANTGNTKGLKIAALMWLKHHLKTNELTMGLKILSDSPQAGSIQLIKEGETVGYSLRCIAFPEHVLTPTLPFKKGHQVKIQIKGEEHQEELMNLVLATASCKVFNLKNRPTETAAVPPNGSLPPPSTGKQEPTQKLSDTDFDSIWSSL